MKNILFAFIQRQTALAFAKIIIYTYFILILLRHYINILIIIIKSKNLISHDNNILFIYIILLYI